MRLRYLVRRAGSLTASIVWTCGLVVIAAVFSTVGLTLDVTNVGFVGLRVVGSCTLTLSYRGPISLKRRNPSASSSVSRAATFSSNVERCALVAISTGNELVTVPGSSTSARSGCFPSSAVSPPAKGCLQGCLSLVLGCSILDFLNPLDEFFGSRGLVQAYI